MAGQGLSDLLDRLFPNAKQATIDAFAGEAPTRMPEFGISDSANRLHYFLAQIGHESGGLTVLEENLNYTADRILEVFSSRVHDPPTAERLAHNPEALANHVYGNRPDLGNDQPGDGFKYRGRGFIQITGKATYRRISELVGLDLVAQPDLAADPDHCLHLACGFWEMKNLNPICDRTAFTELTKRINGGLNGIDDRRERLAKAREIVPFPLDFGPGVTLDDEVTGTVIVAEGEGARWLFVSGRRRRLTSDSEIRELQQKKLLSPGETTLSRAALEAIPVIPGALPGSRRTRVGNAGRPTR